MLRNILDLDPVKIKDLAAGKDCGDYLVLLRGRQDKNRVLRRFLERFQQGITSLNGKHVDLIDDIDLIISLLWSIPYLIDQCTEIIYRVVGRCIEFVDIEGTVGIKCLAGIAGITGFGICSKVFAIDGFGENSGTGCLPNPSRATKKKGLGKVVVFDCILQGGGDML